MQSDQFNAEIVSKFKVTEELVILRVKPNFPIQDFQPGQYTTLALPGGALRPQHFPAEKDPPDPTKLVKRVYSIGSSPVMKEYLEFYIAILPQGLLTSRLALLEEGSKVYMAPKITGTFTLQGVPDDHNLVMVATGTGIAPFISMLRTPSVWTPGRKIKLLHGVRHIPDLAYREELLDLASKNPNFKYCATVSRDAPLENEIRKGYVQNFFESGETLLKPEVDHVFMCGNPGMIDDMERLLLSQGYTEHSRKNPGNMHLERYW